MVRERVLQPPGTKFLVELDLGDDVEAGIGVKRQVWLTRASLRLLQVAFISICSDDVIS